MIRARENHSSGMATRFVPLSAGLLLVTTAAILGLSYLVASLQNQLSAGQSRQIVEALLEREKRDIGRSVLDYAVWDAAYENLARDYSAAWAAEKIGPYLAEELGIDSALVLRVDPRATDGGQDRVAPESVRFAMLEGRLIESGPATRRLADVPALLALARAAAADRRALPEPTAAYVLVNGRAYMAAASPVTDKARPELAARPGPRTTLIFMRTMDADWFADFRQGFFLKDIRFAARDPAQSSGSGAERDSNDGLAIAIDNPLGVRIGALRWEPPRPGSRLLWILMPAAAVILTICGVLNYLLVSQWRRLYTSLLNSEIEMRASRERAETANRLKSQFLANVSHEIRTPMTAILGHTELLQDTPEIKTGAAAEQIHASLVTIERNGRHLLELINDILDLSHLESGLDLHELRIESIDIAGFLGECLELLAHKTPEKKDIALTAGWRRPVPARIQSDPLRLRQVLLNLIGNAIKFTDSGFVRLELDYLDEPDGARLAFTVADSGRGIDLTRDRNLLQAFVQSSGNRPGDGGTGLGLAISTRLVQALGDPAGIRIDSEPGRGSRFSFSLPASSTGTRLPPRRLREFSRNPENSANEHRPAGPPDAPVPKKLKTPPPSLGHLRVLVADDGADNRILLGRILGAAAVTPRVVENGREAVEAARAAVEAGAPYDAILMDMQMPEMDGYEATRTLRASGYRGLICALTAYAMPEDRERCLATGCDEYLSKPVSRIALYSLLARIRPTAKPV
ncbi:MAG: ATP-binding protein [Leptospirales bacterium]|jgi:signal transduction histidine kinase